MLRFWTRQKMANLKQIFADKCGIEKNSIRKTKHTQIMGVIEKFTKLWKGIGTTSYDDLEKFYE